MTAISPLCQDNCRAFLRCATPAAWIDAALANLAPLLIDHANCELKAAQTAQGLMWKYGSNNPSGSNHANGAARGQYRLPPGAAFALLNKLSRLAREELRHFEQVLAFMKKREIGYQPLSAARYASGLRAACRSHEPAKLVDTLLIGAIIEARSCERFEALAPHLDPALGKFYLSLLKSEARHYQDYLKLAALVATEAEIAARLDALLALEQDLIQSPDHQFRFHSGVPDLPSGH